MQQSIEASMNDDRNNEGNGGGPVEPGRGSTLPGPSADPRPRQLAPPIAPRSVYRRHTASGHSGSARQKIKHLKLLATVLLALLVSVAVAASMLLFQVQRLRGDAEHFATEIAQRDNELAKAREKITQMSNDMRALLSNRIPGITELVNSRQVEINDKYFKNITFVQSGVGDSQAIEFSAVLENQTPDPVLPQVDIVLFDELGLQTGASRLDKSQTITPATMSELQPGETRTYSGSITLQRKTPSKYFVVDVN